MIRHHSQVDKEHSKAVCKELVLRCEQENVDCDHVDYRWCKDTLDSKIQKMRTDLVHAGTVTNASECIITQVQVFKDDLQYTLPNNTMVWPHWEDTALTYKYMWHKQDGTWKKLRPKTGGGLILLEYVLSGKDADVAGLPVGRTHKEALELELTRSRRPCTYATEVADDINRRIFQDEGVSKAWWESGKFRNMKKGQKLFARALGPKVLICGVPDSHFRKKRYNMKVPTVNSILKHVYGIDDLAVTTVKAEHRPGERVGTIVPDSVMAVRDRIRADESLGDPLTVKFIH